MAKKHMQLRSSNPLLQSKSFKGNLITRTDGQMTLGGTINKSACLLLLTMACAYYAWGQASFIPLTPLIIAALVTAVYTVYKPQHSALTSPLYAILEGAILGIVSSSLEQEYPGIAMQAITLTFCVFAALLMAYKTRLVKVTSNFKLMVVSATGGILIMYLLSWVMSLLGHPLTFLYDNSWLSIGISLFIVVIAALNLVMDFDFIEEGCEQGCPKYMEWYAAFSLLVTVIWLYLEILRLLLKFRSR